MWLGAALLTALIFGTNNTIFKWGVTRRYATEAIQFFFYATAFLLVFGYGMVTRAFQPTPLSLLLGAAIGFLNGNGNIQMSRAYEDGPASLVSPLIAGNTVLSVLAAGLIFHESISLIHWAGIFLIFGSVIAMQYKPSSGGKKESGKWLFHVVIAMLCFGFVGIFMKTAAQYQIQSLDLLVAMYGGGALYLVLGMKKSWYRSGEIQTGVVVAVLSVIGYYSYFYALTTGVASIVYPVVSLNCLVVMAGGYYFFAERLKQYQLIGVGTALLGLVLTRV